MTTAEFLSSLRDKGFRLWTEGDKLRYKGPRGALSGKLKAQLVERKAEILAILAETQAASSRSPSITRAATSDGALPLSYAEQGLWLLDQLRPGLTAYNVQSCLRLRGSLNRTALEQSLDTIIQRHEILRSRYRFVDEQPVRVVDPTLHLSLPVTDLASLADPEPAIWRIAASDRSQPFDLSQDLLLRANLLSLSDEEHLLLLTMHHIVTDAWSYRIFFQELLILYDAYVTGKPAALPDLAIQYSDFAIWQRQISREGMQSHLSYWKAKLRGAPVTEVPFDHPRPSRRSFCGARQEIALSRDLSDAIRELCKRERTTLFMILLATFKILLHRYTGQTDIVVGSTLAGRNRPELGNLIGFFINVMVLRTDLSGQPSFRDLLRRVREVFLEGFEHQDVSFETLLETLKPERRLDRDPLFQVLFNMASLPAIQPGVAGVGIENVPLPEEQVRFDLTFHAPETRDGINLVATYSTDLFTQARISEMLEQYKYLLQQIVNDPERRIDGYSLVTASARAVLPDPTQPLDDSWEGAIHEIIAQYAKSQPSKLAVEDAQEAWSYEELNQRSNQLAHRLLAAGIQPEEIVAVYGPRCAGMVWALLGILKAGAAFLVIDPQHPAQRVSDYLEIAKPRALIEVGGAKLEGFASPMPFSCRITLPSLAGARSQTFLEAQATRDPAIETSKDAFAYVIFTSGSTGKPKAVMGRHGPLTHFLPWLKEKFHLSGDDHFSFLSSLSTNKLQREIFTALGLGASLYVPGGDVIGSPGALDAWMRTRRISVVHLTPAMAELLAETATATIPTVRRAFFGGDLLRMKDVERARRLMPQAEIANFYNSSETQRGGGYVTFSAESPHRTKSIPPLGRGVKDVQLLVLNRNRQMAGVGELGEIGVRSPHMARGYWQDEALTNERFITNPFTGMEGDRVYRTGEQGRYLPDGDVEFVARGEDHFSIRGFRVDLGEVESVLSSHASVAQATVVGQESPSERLVAYFTIKKGCALGTSALRDFAKTKLPDYMIPAIFVPMESMPWTPTGKVDRRALPAPREADLLDARIQYVAPRNATERMLRQIWSEVLGVERIGINDNFFDLGGHSLAATRVMSRVSKQIQVEMPIRTLFEAPTIALLTVAIAQHQIHQLDEKELAQIQSEW